LGGLKVCLPPERNDEQKGETGEFWPTSPESENDKLSRPEKRDAGEQLWLFS
jgi:hypothetical protein